MLSTIVLAMIFAKIKHYKIGVIFKSWTFYPILLIESVFLFIKIATMSGNYNFVKYVDFLKFADLAVYLIPIFVLQLYKPAIVGSASVFVGTLLNKFVIAQNGGKMPVFPTLSRLTGYIKPDTLEKVSDTHVWGDTSTRWKILTDYIDFGVVIYSIGDVFIHFYVFLIIYKTIAALNRKKEKSAA
jgi:hypothetical protein